MKKIVKEILYEKFIEKSDPITDMSIGMIKIAKKFLKDYNISEDDINKPSLLLMHAARFNHIAIVKYALKKGADIHWANDLSLRWAILEKNYEIVKYLIDKGANVNTDIEKPLEIACSCRDDKMIKILCKAGAKLNDKILRELKYRHFSDEEIEHIKNICKK